MHLDKDPHAELDLIWDWSDWLESGETISSASVVASGVSVMNTPGTSSSDPVVTDGTSELTGATVVDAAVVQWVEGGQVGYAAHVTCRITTSDSRVDDRTFVLRIVER